MPSNRSELPSYNHLSMSANALGPVYGDAGEGKVLPIEYVLSAHTLNLHQGIESASGQHRSIFQSSVYFPISRLFFSHSTMRGLSQTRLRYTLAVKNSACCDVQCSGYMARLLASSHMQYMRYICLWDASSWLYSVYGTASARYLWFLYSIRQASLTLSLYFP